LEKIKIIMDYIFKIGQKFGDIPLNITDKDINKILGKPDNFNKETGVECYTSNYQYLKQGLDISFIHFDKFDNELQIQTNKIIFNNNNLYSLQKNKILSIIEKEHKLRKIKYEFECQKYEFSDAESEEEYEFEQIGLTLWFVKNNLSNVCISSLINNEL